MCFEPLLNYTNLVQKSLFWYINTWKLNSKFGYCRAKGEFLGHPSYAWRTNSVTVPDRGRLPAQAMQPRPAFLSAQQLSGSCATTSQLQHHSGPPSTGGWSFQKAADKFLHLRVSEHHTYVLITYSESLWDQSIGRTDQCPGTGKMPAKLQSVGVHVLFAFFSQKVKNQVPWKEILVAFTVRTTLTVHHSKLHFFNNVGKSQ